MSAGRGGTSDDTNTPERTSFPRRGAHGCGQKCPMPLGFDPPHPGGMADSSPTFERGCAGLDVHKSRQGRLNPCEIGQSSFQDLSCCGRWFPTLKCLAILACPSGTKAWTDFSGLLWDQILVALDILVRRAWGDERRHQHAREDKLPTPARPRMRTKMSALRKQSRLRRGLFFFQAHILACRHPRVTSTSCHWLPDRRSHHHGRFCP